LTSPTTPKVGKGGERRGLKGWQCSECGRFRGVKNGNVQNAGDLEGSKIRKSAF